MTYIQDKLEEFDESFAKCGIVGDREFKEFLPLTYNEIKRFTEQSLTDYHNHIVEKIVKDVDMTDQQLQEILSLLQETNKNNV